MSAAYRTTPDTLEAIRADLDALVGGAVVRNFRTGGSAMGIPMTGEAGIPVSGAFDRAEELALFARRPNGLNPDSAVEGIAAGEAESTALRANTAKGLGSVSDPEITALDEPPTAAKARRLHMRRQLGAALEWGFAFLDAFDLGPLALDVVDDAIATLDALDGDPDIEDDSEEDEGTALERHGMGFASAGADDAEDDDPAEHDDRGTDGPPAPWHRRWTGAVAA